MDNQSSLETLDEKVSQILKQYHFFKSENEILRREVVTLKSESEMKNQEIEKLRDLNTQKDIEIDEIVSKIESIIG